MYESIDNKQLVNLLLDNNVSLTAKLLTPVAVPAAAAAPAPAPVVTTSQPAQQKVCWSWFVF